MKEQPKFPPQPYTQKLLDAGIIEFCENIDEWEEDEYVVVYHVKKDYIAVYNAELISYTTIKSIAYAIVEYYISEHNDNVFKFECFNVFLVNENDDSEDIINPDEMILIYKKIEI
jgi:hypothetical protein